jgi:hypothetical protein
MAAAACGDRGHQAVGLWSPSSGRWGRASNPEALLASAAKRGADEMADRCLIENREAAVGVQVFHLRQRWGAAVWRAQTQEQSVGQRTDIDI